MTGAFRVHLKPGGVFLCLSTMTEDQDPRRYASDGSSLLLSPPEAAEVEDMEANRIGAPFKVRD